MVIARVVLRQTSLLVSVRTRPPFKTSFRNKEELQWNAEEEKKN
jgi:hypothetical protein